MRRTFIPLLFCLLNSMVLCNDDSDLKFAINTDIIQFKSIDLNAIITSPIELINEKELKNLFAHVYVKNGALIEIDSPQEVKVSADSSKSSLTIILNQLNVKLNIGEISLTTLKFVKEKFKKIDVDVTLKEVEITLAFQGNQINILDLKFKAKSIRVRSKSALLNAALLSVSEIAKLEINRSQKKMKKKLQEAINKNIDQEFTLQIKKLHNILKLKITESIQLFFPESKSLQFLEDKTNSFITLGVVATKIENVMPKGQSLNEAIIPFPDGTWTRSGAVLVTDSFINKYLAMYQTTTIIDIFVDKDKAGNSLPFTLDSSGLQILLPELNNKYPSDAKDGAIHIWLPKEINECYIKCNTIDEGVIIKASFNLEIQIKDDKNNFEIVFGSIIHLKAKANVVVDKDNISLSIFYLGLTDTPIEKINTLGTTVNLERFKNSVSNILNAALLTTPIPVVDPNKILFSQHIPLIIKRIDIDHEDGYTSLVYDAVYNKIK